MEKITVSAKTLNDAVTEATIQLRIPSDQLAYEVVEKGSSGLFGIIGVKKAVIKAWKKEEEKKTSEDFGYEKNFERQKRFRKDIKLVRAEKDTIELCEKFLYDVLRVMDMKVKIHSEVDKDGNLSINMSGENIGILIGKRGQTLDALQYLANRVANKLQEGYVRVKLDVEDYRSRRKETLENLARGVARKVKKTKKTVFLEPMNPYERRIIHSALQGDKGITTYSEGDEPYRYVVVTLARR